MRADLTTNVQAWLDQADPSYPAGLELLAAAGFDQTSLTWQLLQRGADSFTRPKLRDCLTAVLSAGTPVLAPAPLPPVVSGHIPAPDQALKARLLNERTELKARLRAILEQPDRAAERLTSALRIKVITQELDRLYDPEAFVEPAKETKPLTLANLRTYVSLYKKKVRQQPGNATYAQKLTHYQTLLTKLTHETI
ncbi:hypothetical protein [Fibrivirga algicola]|uniref:Uncharacterized protein n=1 Tax=Fibrivirga algicola TaxID=2950420 RepID=A0ABX0QSN3_9BACT|nr:hypothetical protein [Fibrivirga algicola]NID13768.1 hypothetical protein [Fibrivirga algicola]